MSASDEKHLIIKLKALAIGTSLDKLKSNIKINFELNDFSQSIIIENKNLKNDLS